MKFVTPPALTANDVGCEALYARRRDRVRAGGVVTHLYLNGLGGTKYEVSIGKDASGKDVVTATPVGK
jgi:hypothetical protein